MGSGNREESEFVEVERIWRENRCLTERTIGLYRRWARRYTEYCHRRGVQPGTQLTYAGVIPFIRAYVRRRGVGSAHTLENGRAALHRWAEALLALGEALPPWREGIGIRARRRVLREPCALLKEYAEHMRRYRGNAPRTIDIHRFHVEHLLRFLRQRGRSLRQVRLLDIDALLIERRRHWSIRTLSDLCNALRGFLRFLHLTGRLKADLACAVMAPRIRANAHPPRALPWPDVQRILRGIERKTPVGRRDYALLLMMSLYGCGAGEIVRLALEDIDWQAGTVRVVRPKTGVEILLPLLPALASALTDYLRHGRPRHAPTRAVFVRMKPPHLALARSAAVQHILSRWALRAQVKAPFLGSHALRHTHACRQMELGTRPKIVGDILGHRDLKSTSVYMRVALERLRTLSLPAPR